MSIGNRIKQKRKELDLSVEKLAELLGKNRATIYRYENGEIENLPIEILEPLASVLRTTPAYLMGWNDENENELVVKEESTYHVNRSNSSLFEYFDQNDFSWEECNEIIKYAEFLKTKR